MDALLDAKEALATVSYSCHKDNVQLHHQLITMYVSIYFLSLCALSAPTHQRRRSYILSHSKLWAELKLLGEIRLIYI
eukprot:118589-Amphidinium_carterae.1